jgi:hypothetical protein
MKTDVTYRMQGRGRTPTGQGIECDVHQNRGSGGGNSWGRAKVKAGEGIWIGSGDEKYGGGNAVNAVIRLYSESSACHRATLTR